MNRNVLPPQQLKPGTIVTVHMRGWRRVGRHFALVTAKTGSDGLPMVVTNSGDFGGPAEQDWSGFVKGRRYHAFYPGRLAPHAVLENAYALFGTRYHLLRWNCEHFANMCHGRGAQSRQVRSGLVLAAMACVGLFAAVLRSGPGL